MKTITLEEAIELLENASALIVNKNALVYPSLGGDEEDEIMFLRWNDEDGTEFSHTFLGTNNKTVTIKDNNLILLNRRGIEVKIGILDLRKL